MTIYFHGGFMRCCGQYKKHTYIWCSVGHHPPPPPMGMGLQYPLVLLVPPPVACGGLPPCGLCWWYVSIFLSIYLSFYVSMVMGLQYPLVLLVPAPCGLWWSPPPVDCAGGMYLSFYLSFFLCMYVCMFVCM